MALSYLTRKRLSLLILLVATLAGLLALGIAPGFASAASGLKM